MEWMVVGLGCCTILFVHGIMGWYDWLLEDSSIENDGSIGCVLQLSILNVGT